MSHTLCFLFFFMFSSSTMSYISLVLIFGNESNYVFTLGSLVILMYWEGFLKFFFNDFFSLSFISISTPSMLSIGNLSWFSYSLYLSNSLISFLFKIYFHLLELLALSLSFLIRSANFEACYFLILSTAAKKWSFSGTFYWVILWSSRNDFLGLKFLICYKNSA